MRTLVLFLALFLGATLTSRAQETLFSRVEGFGGFGGPVFKLTRAFDQTALAAGGRGGGDSTPAPIPRAPRPVLDLQISGSGRARRGR